MFLMIITYLLDLFIEFNFIKQCCFKTNIVLTKKKTFYNYSNSLLHLKSFGRKLKGK